MVTFTEEIVNRKLQFLWSVSYAPEVSMVLVPWEMMLFWGIGVEFKGKVMLNYSREVE